MKDFIQASRKWGLQKPRCISERERECVCVCVSETEPLLGMCLIYGRDFRSLPKPSNVSGRDSLYQHSELIYWRAQETVRRTFCRFARS